MSLRTFLRDYLIGPDGESRSVTTTTSDVDLLGQYGLLESGGRPFGEPVTATLAIRVAVVKACVHYIADTIATLPVHVIERDGESRTRVDDHPVANFLRSPSPGFPRFTVIQSLIASALMHGDGIAPIRFAGRREPEVMTIFDPRRVVLEYLDEDSLFPQSLIYELTHPKTGRVYRLPERDVLHIRGLVMDGKGRGLSAIKAGASAIGVARVGENYAGNMYQGGGKPPGTITVPGSMSDKAFARFREQVARILNKLQTSSGTTNTEPLILEDGAQFNPWGITAEDAQLLESRKFQREEIATLFRVPPHKVGILDKATFSNIEQQNIDALTDCLMPWIKQLEEECSRKLIPADQRGRFSVTFDIRGILRGDMVARTTGYRNLTSIGAMTPDEVRALEDMNPLPDGMGERARVPVNTMPIPTKVQAEQHVNKIVAEAKDPGPDAPSPGDGSGGGNPDQP